MNVFEFVQFGSTALPTHNSNSTDPGGVQEVYTMTAWGPFDQYGTSDAPRDLRELIHVGVYVADSAADLATAFLAAEALEGKVLKLYRKLANNQIQSITARCTSVSRVGRAMSEHTKWFQEMTLRFKSSGSWSNDTLP